MLMFTAPFIARPIKVCRLAAIVYIKDKLNNCFDWLIFEKAFEKPERQDCLVEKVNNRMSVKHGYMGISSGYEMEVKLRSTWI